jgi:hypothetical protein
MKKTKDRAVFVPVDVPVTYAVVLDNEQLGELMVAVEWSIERLADDTSTIGKRRLKTLNKVLAVIDIEWGKYDDPQAP